MKNTRGPYMEDKAKYMLWLIIRFPLFFDVLISKVIYMKAGDS